MKWLAKAVVSVHKPVNKSAQYSLSLTHRLPPNLRLAVVAAIADTWAEGPPALVTLARWYSASV